MTGYLRLEGGASFDGEGYIVKEDNHLTTGHIIIEDVPAEDTSNYVICDRSGFKTKVKDGLKSEWDRLLVLDEFWEPRNIQDTIRKVTPERQRGAIRPEGAEDSFVGANEVTQDDL